MFKHITVFAAVLAVLLGTTATAQAQVTSGFLEVEYTLQANGATPQMDAYLHGPIAGKIGWTAWTLTSKGWSEALFGVTYAPEKWVEVSMTAGLESDIDPFRVGTSVWVGRGRLSFLSLQEQGGSGHWQKNVGAYQVNKTVALGVLQQTFVGTGPYAEVKVGKVSVWGSYAIADNRGLLSARFNF